MSDDHVTYEARLEAVLESISDAFYAVDGDWRYVIFNRAAEQYFGASAEQVLGHRIWDLFPQGIGTDFERYCRAAMDEGVATSFETPSRFHADRVVELRISPIRGGGFGVALTDVTERRRAEDALKQALAKSEEMLEMQQLLVNELNHRVKNALATVQSIAAQSLKGPDVSAEARERFTSRLLALARANDLLVAQEWSGATLRAIAQQVASPHAGGSDQGRFTIQGPDVDLNPRAATAVALALHELATNAAKYGALSLPTGRVELSWLVEDEAFQMTWRETGGPPAAEPRRVGFGTRLIRKGLSSELRADVQLDYSPAGLVCTVSAPLSGL